MKILITGGNGQLGLELEARLQAEIRKSNKNYQIISTDHRTLDITNMNQVKSVLTNNRIDIVINCAAYTAVDNCETDIENAYKVNAIGPKNLAIICEEIGAKLVQISTDYVFDGESPEPRREDDLTGPKTMYGKSKLLGEEYVKTFCKKHFIVRTAWLYGKGNNFVQTMLKLAQTNKEISVVGDQYGSPTSTKDLASGIIGLMTTDYYGTFHGVCNGECSWYDFAVKIFELKDINVVVNKVTSEEFIRPAKRPKYSVLENFMLNLYDLNSFRPWEEALEDYLKNN